MAIKLSIKKRNANGKTAELKTFDDAFITIGSDPSATIFLQDSSIAFEQAVIISEGDEFLLINRADGTKLNFESLFREERRVLSQGDELLIGDFLLSLYLNGDALLTEKSETPTETALVATNGQQLQKQPQEKSLAVQHKGFADILEKIRTEEDKYYFQIEIEGKSKQRLPLIETDMVLGWDLTQKHLSLIPNIVVSPRATIRKDWSGVLIQPQGERMIWLNGEELTTQTRLQNGDRLAITNAEGFLSEISVVFYEPMSMLVLDSLLPQQLPPPTYIEEDKTEDIPVLTKTNPPAVKSPKNQYTIFGYFSMAEVAVMVVGTLVTAFIIFLVLEISS